MADHTVRVSEIIWRKLRNAAFSKETSMKTLLENLINEKLDQLNYK